MPESIYSYQIKDTGEYRQFAAATYAAADNNAFPMHCYRQVIDRFYGYVNGYDAYIAGHASKHSHSTYINTDRNPDYSYAERMTGLLSSYVRNTLEQGYINSLRSQD